MGKGEGKKDFSNEVKLQIPSDPRYVSVTRNFIYNLAREQGFSLYDSADLKLVIGEALSNIIKHAYSGKKEYPIFLELKFLADRLEIRIRDFGIQSGLLQAKGYDLSDYREEGLGMYLLQKLTDHFYVDSSQEVGNKIILMKKK